MDYAQSQFKMHIIEIQRKFNEWYENTLFELMHMVGASNYLDLIKKGYEIKVELVSGSTDKTIKLINLSTKEMIHGYTIKIETSFKSHDNFVHSSEMKVTREPILYHGGK
ncbi:hypothetical protein PP657_gp018 [Bacillus phage BCPST]|uniref:Uncharacterized protein n=2 Tax=Yihwangvirus TaxID=3044863 RepID=A0AAE7TQ64_9CAUD|nr:hypothetical protein PP656_gp035 [Bacillus phage pW4]YP_010657271.1 hypothetical protein PP657_gp018 [Bacillus phage BCPST]AZU99119.1 hypothetical protein pW4_107 [Bacillus phage pW4]QQO38636.1 hypothetical protein BCPST_018 [Bacillus phage BCPST]QSJ04226.1 hypothetical protein BCP6_021 [Bacillus phage BCP6]